MTGFTEGFDTADLKDAKALPDELSDELLSQRIASSTRRFPYCVPCSRRAIGPAVLVRRLLPLLQFPARYAVIPHSSQNCRMKVRSNLVQQLIMNFHVSHQAR
jgi:hypothetical protein